MLLSLENWFLFHPAPADHWDPPPSEIHAHDVELALGDGVTIHAWWCPTESWEPNKGALLYCHGNAGNLSFRGPNIARFQQSLGIAVLIFDYPGFGRSTGRPTEAGCYAAADAAYDWLIAKQNIAPKDVILYGRSLGGAVATELATRKPHRALVLASSFTSIPDMAQTTFPWLPARWLVRNRFDNLAKIAQCVGPVFVAHGTADSLIPFAHGERLFAAAREPKQFRAMSGLEHNHAPDETFYDALGEFLDKAR
ncbi:MAG TPA: alpha/beta hydrolase [Planctomycetaceae bacterium]|nr:alpha/beta hydrolase [Planctomycetaceae bacterium]